MVLNDNTTFDIASGSLLVLGDIVTGAGSLTKEGTGILELSTTSTRLNSYGGTIVNAGIPRQHEWLARQHHQQLECHFQ